MADTALWEKIRIKIRDLMASQEITHAEMAKRTGISGPQMSHYLGGRNTPGIEKLPLLADALGVRVVDLLESGEAAKPALRKPTQEELMLAILQNFDLEPKRKVIAKLALSALSNDIEYMHDTILAPYIERVIGRAANNKKPSAG